MAEIVKNALKSTCTALNEELQVTPLSLINESVFRFFFVRNLRRLWGDCRCQIEWHRIDLLVQNEDRTKNMLIEFKFYVLPKSYNLSGDSCHSKGGPSGQNVREFRECLKKLSTVQNTPYLKNETHSIWKKYLILVYMQHAKYCSCYDKIQLPEELRSSCHIVDEYNVPPMTDPTTNEQLLCKLIEIA